MLTLVTSLKRVYKEKQTNAISQSSTLGWCIPMQKRLTYLTLLLVAFISLWMLGFAAPQNKADEDLVKEVLIINSYHKGYKWSDDITDAIASTLNVDDFRFIITIEYLDTQRTDYAESEGHYEALFYAKYKDRQPDLVMSTDDAAYQFLLEYSEKLFPEVPIVFCGVNQFNPSELTYRPHFTGVVEGFDIESTLETALKLHPNTSSIYYINDGSLTGLAIQEALDQSYQNMAITIPLVRLEGDLEDIEQMIPQLPKDSMILFLIFFKDSQETYDESQAISRVAAISQVPIYGVWEFGLNKGIVGGKLTSGFYQGETAARLALRILHGEQVHTLPVMIEKKNEFMFDDVYLKKFKISTEKLPENSLIINQVKPTHKKVLVLNAYNKGLKWTDDVELGIEETLNDAFETLEIVHEYMDVKRINSPVYLTKVYDFLYYKLRDQYFDLIITTDDAAYEFMTKYHSRLSHETPVVFCGVNYIDDLSDVDRNWYTGVLETFDIEGTLDLMVSVHPQVKHILVINDLTTTGKGNKKRLESVMSNFTDRVTFEFLEDINMVDLQRVVSNLDESNLILLLSFNQDKSLNSYSYDESIQLISAYASVPIYGIWDFYLGRGLLGGMLTSGYEQGELAAQSAIKILRGQTTKDIPIIALETGKPMFDQLVMDRYQLTPKHIPHNSTILNKHSTFEVFYEANKTFVNTFVIILMVAALIIVFTLLVIFLLVRNQKIKKEVVLKERRYAMTDALTGIGNRRACFEYLNERLNEGPRGSTVKVCFVDLDQLKFINDTFGHAEGDEMLKTFVQHTSTILTNQEQFFRLGGDEFLIISVGQDPHHLEQVMTKLEQTFEMYRQKHHKPYTIRFSYGFADGTNATHHSADSLIEAADQEMYHMKLKHRDQEENHGTSEVGHIKVRHGKEKKKRRLKQDLNQDEE